MIRIKKPERPARTTTKADARDPRSAESVLARIYARMRELRATGEAVTDRSISLKAGASDGGTIRSIRRNLAAGTQYGVSVSTISKLSRALGVTSDWLASGSGPKEPGGQHLASEDVPPPAELDGTKPVRVVGYVGAGSAAKPDTGGEDIFFHVSSLLPGVTPSQGDPVIFEMGVDRKTRRIRAERITIG